MAATSVNSIVPHGIAMQEPAVREYPKKLVIRSQNRIFLQTVAEIDYLTAAANYVNIHTAGQVFRIRSTINAIEQRLDPQKFGRVHRCTIVNLERVKEFQPLQRGDYLLTLNDGHQVKMSRRHRDQLEKITACATGRHLLKYEGADKQ
jgi:two-component system LytT family response regulator